MRVPFFGAKYTYVVDDLSATREQAIEAIQTPRYRSARARQWSEDMLCAAERHARTGKGIADRKDYWWIFYGRGVCVTCVGHEAPAR